MPHPSDTVARWVCMVVLGVRVCACDGDSAIVGADTVAFFASVRRFHGFGGTIISEND